MHASLLLNQQLTSHSAKRHADVATKRLQIVTAFMIVEQYVERMEKSHARQANKQ